MDLKQRPKIAILASGRGSNFEAIVRAIESGWLPADLVAVASDKSTAPVLKKALDLGFEAFVEADQRNLCRTLLEKKVDYVVLAGYMKVLKIDFVNAFMDPRGISRIVNIHPSLLPAFPGLDSYRRAFESGAQESGVTVHFVDSGVDTGPICAQRAFSIQDCKTLEDVERRGLAIEHELYPNTLRWILSGQFSIEEREGKLHVLPY